ncbi:hypothetical protein [uncultured Porphyromonas sp.]|nr:hypothetical protein [uncultured Porphyromonas sp.]
MSPPVPDGRDEMEGRREREMRESEEGVGSRESEEERLRGREEGER